MLIGWIMDLFMARSRFSYDLTHICMAEDRRVVSQLVERITLFTKWDFMIKNMNYNFSINYEMSLLILT